MFTADAHLWENVQAQTRQKYVKINGVWQQSGYMYFLDTPYNHVLLPCFLFQEADSQTPDEDQDLDTTASGSWMKKWEIVHTNRHTDKFF